LTDAKRGSSSSRPPLVSLAVFKFKCTFLILANALDALFKLNEVFVNAEFISKVFSAGIFK
jgi:hypothetical protein